MKNVAITSSCALLLVLMHLDASANVVVAFIFVCVFGFVSAFWLCCFVTAFCCFLLMLFTDVFLLMFFADAHD